jgi:GPH family glycoside/pentoside/hexuronide:cation symporter
MMGIVFAVVSALPLLLVFFGTRERPAYMWQAQPRLRESLRVAFRNKPFVFGLLIFLMTWIAVVILQDNLAYFIKHVLQREGDSELIMATIFVTAIVVLPFWNWVSQRTSKRWAYMGGIAFWAVVQIVLITVTAGTGLAIILLLCVLAGIGVAAAHVLPWAIIPDSIEWSEYQTGERHEGIYYSLVTLLRKAATSIAIPATLWLLHFTGYDGMAERQPDSALLGLRLVIGPIPAVLLCAGIAFAFFYPLTRRKHAEVVAELEERRARTTQGAP